MGPYEIVERIGEVAYRLRLPLELARIHDVFLVSMLRKYIGDPSHVLRDQPVELKEDLTYEERPVQIVDRKDQVLRNKVIPLVKVLWMNHGREDVTPPILVRSDWRIRTGFGVRNHILGLLIIIFFSELTLYLWYTNNFCNNQQSFTFKNELPPEWYPFKFIHSY